MDGKSFCPAGRRSRLRLEFAVLFFIAACLSPAGIPRAAEDPFAAELKAADKAMRHKEYGKVAEILEPVLERRPDHPLVRAALAEAWLESGRKAAGLRMLLSALMFQGNKPAWTKTDKKAYRKLEKLLLKYDLDFRDIRKLDADFIKSAEKFLKKINKPETRDAFEEYLFACREIAPGNSKIRRFFETGYRGEKTYAERFVYGEEPGEEFDLDNPEPDDLFFIFDFREKTDLGRMLRTFRFQRRSNPAVVPVIENGRLRFNFDYGDPYAYLEHRRTPMLPGRELRVSFYPADEGRLLLGTPYIGIGLVIDFGSRKAYRFEQTEGAANFTLPEKGPVDAVLQYTKNECLVGFVGGEKVLDMPLDPGQRAWFASGNVFFGVEDPAGKLRIASIYYGPAREIIVYEEIPAEQPDSMRPGGETAPPDLKSGEGGAEKREETAAEPKIELEQGAPEPEIEDAPGEAGGTKGAVVIPSRAERDRSEKLYREALSKLETAAGLKRKEKNKAGVLRKEALLLLADSTGNNPLNWKAHEKFAEACLALGRRRDAVRAWRRALFVASDWGEGEPGAAGLVEEAKKRLSELDTEAAGWREITAAYVEKLLEFRKKFKTDKLSVERIDARIHAVRPEVELEPIDFEKPEQKPVEQQEIPVLPGLELD